MIATALFVVRVAQISLCYCADYIRKVSSMWKRELLKNKLYSVALVSLGALSIPVEYDVTAFVFSLMIGIPLFFSKENWIT